MVVGFVTLNAIRLPSGPTGGGLVPQQRTINIVNGLITVQARGYQAYPFAVPTGATNIRVSGTFTASGGSGNDIIVVIMDETAFTNWKNGHQVSTFYNSGQLTTSSISASVLAGGTYYLVYANTFSTLSSKNVQTTVDLTYTI